MEMKNRKLSKKEEKILSLLGSIGNYTIFGAVPQDRSRFPLQRKRLLAFFI
jgi:hypothetical protein